MRTDCARNIILIGMPGAGKSTVGVLLAKRLGYHFTDSDLLMQVSEGCHLQKIIRDRGMDGFMRLEEDILKALVLSRSVLATGGSAIYSEPGMARLREQGQVVFIDLPLEVLQERVTDMDSRGLVIAPGESFDQLYRERLPLYRRHADLVVPALGLTAEQLAAAIEQQVCGAATQESTP